MAKFSLLKKQITSLEYYVLITPPEGEPFACRINEVQNTLQLIDNAGDVMEMLNNAIKPPR